MDKKKSGWLFLTVIVAYIGTGFALSILPIGAKMPFGINLFLSEAIIWIPALLFLAAGRVNPVKFCQFRKIHASTALMTVVFAFLAMPAATLMNIFSMFFVENTVVQMSSDILNAGFLSAFLMMAVYGPFCEELVFRGVLLQGYKKSASPLKAILISSFLFGLMHLNFNQAGYAFVLGILMALLAEAAGSIWAPFLFHMAVNGKSVVVLFLSEKLTGMLQNVTQLTGTMAENRNVAVTSKDLVKMLCFESLVATICLPIAGCVLYWIAKKEGRAGSLKALWADRKSGKIWSIPVILAIIISIGFMIYGVL